MKYANCGASVKSSGKVKKMNTGGFMKIGDGLQKLDVNKTDDKVKANKGKAVKKTAKRNEPSRNVKSPKPKAGPKPGDTSIRRVPTSGPKTGGSNPPKRTPNPKMKTIGKRGKNMARFSSGGMAEDKRKDKQEEEAEKKGSKKPKRGELVEASYGKSVRKKKK